ncbi:UNVERIFIED_CONTAM: hypothetical protein FKN15_033962 [Acipenser sinensis]
MAPSGPQADKLAALVSRAAARVQIPWTEETQLRLVNDQLICIAQHSGQAIRRNLGALVVAQHQLWLSQTRVNEPISPGYTFGPAVEEMLQRSYCARDSSKQFKELLPRPTHTQHQGQQQWRPRAAAPQTIVCTVPVAAPPGPSRQYPRNQPSATAGRARQRPQQRPEHSPAGSAKAAATLMGSLRASAFSGP